MDTSDLAKRMKRYEAVSKNVLMTRMPVVLRIDGKAFHTYTKGLDKPFDDILIKAMQYTMKTLCENIQGCVLGYTQSDEISLVLVDYQKLTSDAWFDYEVQKIDSIAASMATMAFNKEFSRLYRESGRAVSNEKIESKLGCAMFDCRSFNLAKEEVTNYLYWRQLDAIRNSIQMVGQANFSQNELQNKACSVIQSMLLEKGINWNDLATYKKRGSCCIKMVYTDDIGFRNRWVIDVDIPVFAGSGRAYVDHLIYVGE